MFYSWLLSQQTRTDAVGRLALMAVTDRHFPRYTHRLYILLRWCAGHDLLRRSMKQAHREWRASGK